MPVLDHALLIKEDGHRQSGRTISLHHPACLVKQDWIGHAQFLGKGSHPITGLLVVHTQHRERFTLARLKNRFDGWDLGPARRTPRGPEVEQDNLTLVITQRDLVALKCLEAKVRCALALADPGLRATGASAGATARCQSQYQEEQNAGDVNWSFQNAPPSQLELKLDIDKSAVLCQETEAVGKDENPHQYQQAPAHQRDDPEIAVCPPQPPGQWPKSQTHQQKRDA
jgi:hypothetical protein